MDLGKWWILVLAIALGVSLTLGSLTLFATKDELTEVAVSNKCGWIQYQIDRTGDQIWQIESRYRDRNGRLQGNLMSPTDARNYQGLIKQLMKWEQYQRDLHCVPGKVG